MTQKKVYALSTQENPEGHPERTMVYACADGWKDQVTAVDGQTVAYDTAGVFCQALFPKKSVRIPCF